MKNKATGFGVVEVVIFLTAVALIGLVVYQLASHSDLMKKDKSASQSSGKVIYEDKDKLKWERHYGLHGLFMAYKISNKEYLPATPEGWAGFVKKYSDNDTLVDPYTNTAYAFTDKEPDYGEIQYMFPASCDEQRKQIVAANSSQSFAFRLKFSDGIRCSHNL